jgi:hypothetical protein
MKYRRYIEENFLIDKAMSAQLVPFIFNPVQEHYYEDLCREYDIERKGINVPMRENILKARREGFSSLILALFAADDLTNDNPTETDVLSYKDDATATFRKRYRTYLLSRFALEVGLSHEEIRNNINLLEEIAPMFLSTDAEDIELKHNKAHFQCNTASARVGGRGGVRHKILFSEIAFYPDTAKMLASEMIEATMRQVDPASGWIFAESTENGAGTYQYKMWMEAKRGRSRFKNRFYGAGHFYTDEQMDVIKSEYVDMDSFRRDYPMTEDDLFKGSAKSFTTEEQLSRMIDVKTADKDIVYLAEFQHQNGLDVAEIIAGELDRLARQYVGYLLYVGIDEAKDIDATCVVVLKGRRHAIGKGGVAGIEIDVTRGDFLADWFERNTNHFVKKVKFSRPSKSLMYSNLQIVIADQLTEIPNWKGPDGHWISDEHKHFFNQMIFLEKEIIGNMLVVHHPEGACNRNDHNYDECEYHDDYPDAWMMAEDIYVEVNGVPRRKKPPQVPTVPNVVQNLLDKGTRHDRNRNRGSAETSFE